MKKSSKRAIRRAHRSRLKIKRSHHWGYGIGTYMGPMPESRLNVIVDTPTPCSCSGCGNPRKYWNAKTIQEVKAYLDELEQVLDAEMPTKLAKNQVGISVW